MERKAYSEKEILKSLVEDMEEAKIPLAKNKLEFKEINVEEIPRSVKQQNKWIKDFKNDFEGFKQEVKNIEKYIEKRLEEKIPEKHHQAEQDLKNLQLEAKKFIEKTAKGQVKNFLEKNLKFADNYQKREEELKEVYDGVKALGKEAEFVFEKYFESGERVLKESEETINELKTQFINNSSKFMKAAEAMNYHKKNQKAFEEILRNGLNDDKSGFNKKGKKGGRNRRDEKNNNFMVKRNRKTEENLMNIEKFGDIILNDKLTFDSKAKRISKGIDDLAATFRTYFKELVVNGSSQSEEKVKILSSRVKHLFQCMLGCINLTLPGQIKDFLEAKSKTEESYKGCELGLEKALQTVSMKLRNFEGKRKKLRKEISKINNDLNEKEEGLFKQKEIERLTKMESDLKDLKYEGQKKVLEDTIKTMKKYNLNESELQREIVILKEKSKRLDVHQELLEKKKGEEDFNSKVFKGIKAEAKKKIKESESCIKDTIDHRGCFIHIKKNDLLNETSEAIVNPANTRLDHGGGAARAISDAAGEGFHKDCDEYIQNYGSLPTGSSMVTRAGGKLNCDFVIHTVGPIYNKQKSDCVKEKQELVESVMSVLDQMKERDFSNVSIPAISSGIYGMPLKLCVSLFAKAIRKKIDSDPQFFEGREINLCNFDDKTTDEFLENFRAEFDKAGYEDVEEEDSEEERKERKKKHKKDRKKKRRHHESDEYDEDQYYDDEDYEDEERPAKKEKSKKKKNKKDKKAKKEKKKEEESYYDEDY